MIASISRKLAFTFPVFYFTAIIDNTPLGKHRAAHMLICGFDPDDKSIPATEKLTISNTISTGYISGSRPVSENLTSHFLSSSRADRLSRITKLGIRNSTIAVAALVRLLKSDILNLDGTSISVMLNLSSTESSDEFLVDMLTLAIKHRVKQPLSKEEQSYLMSLRHGVAGSDENTRADDSKAALLYMRSLTVDPSTYTPDQVQPSSPLEINAPPSSPATVSKRERIPGDSIPPWKRPSCVEPEFLTWPVRAFYTIRELDYAADREEYKNRMLRLHTTTAFSSFSEEDIMTSRDLFRRSDKTFFLQFEGSLSGLADLLLHRVSEKQCLQIVLVCTVNSDKERLRMRNALTNIIDFALADDGRLFFACGYDTELPENEYAIRMIYSIKNITEEEMKRLEVVTKPPVLHLMPAEKYEGRVPDFLLPFKPEWH